MKYNVMTFITNTKNEYSAKVVATFDNFKGARVKYHATAQTLNNATDVLVGVVKIVDEFGNDIQGFREVIDNTPEPEPETEPEQTETETTTE